MKIKSKLPEKKHYSLTNQKDNVYELVDKASNKFRIISPVVNPFDEEWIISINPRQNKSDNTRYVIGITFKLFYISPDNINTQEGIILRELYKSTLAYSQNKTRMFYASQSNQNNIWISYSIILKNNE